MVLQAGLQIGNYRIVRLIGEGGFGEVYLAENPLIERRVAVKVLRSALARDAQAVRRFLNEARAASAIRHPNIIEVLDAGGMPDGSPYILMEFLDGVPLHKRLADVGRLALSKVIDITRQAGAALAAAHAVGIVHRDLKPENLFLVPDTEIPGAEIVKVLDFGIAKMKHGAMSGVRTQAGFIMGSPAYMSPEQCRDSADVDLRSDIYSFGTIVYEMLAGRTPFVSASPTELLAKQLTEPPVRLSVFAPDIPVDVESAIMRSLAKGREDRYDSVRGFLNALRPASCGTELGLAPSLARATTPANLLQPERFAEGIEESHRHAANRRHTTFSGSSGSLEVATPPDANIPMPRLRRMVGVGASVVAVVGLVALLLARPNRAPLPAAATSRPDSAAIQLAGTGSPQPASAGIEGTAPPARRADGGSVPSAGVVPISEKKPRIPDGPIGRIRAAGAAAPSRAGTRSSDTATSTARSGPSSIAGF